VLEADGGGAAVVDGGKAVAQSAIQAQIGQSVNHASATKSLWGRTVVGGQIIEYRAYTLANGTINVGTYYVVP
jgi:hypothetical protein